MQTADYGLIILAAGSSSRLGEAKQLLSFNGTTLLQHSIDEALRSGIKNIVVVTGAERENIEKAVRNTEVSFVYNEHWKSGMAGSVHTGLSFLQKKKSNLAGVIIMLCDQPFVSGNLIQEMIQKKEQTGKGIVACVYNETLGVPVLFDAIYFEQLHGLVGSEGAKKIIMKHADDVASFPFARGAVDIDTMEDYQQLLARINHPF